MMRKLRSARHLKVLALALVAACGAGADSGPGAAGNLVDGRIIDGSNPSCATCSLEVVDSARLGTPTDRDIPQRVPDYVLRDSRGMHYLVFNGWENKPILRYDSTGKYAGKLGAYGGGPGEYDMTGHAFLGPGDSVFVLKFGRRIGHVFAPDGSYGRTLFASTRPIIGAAPDGSGDIYSATSTMVYARMVEGREVIRGDTTKPHVFRHGADGTVKDSFPIFAPPAGMKILGARGPTTFRPVINAKPQVAPDGTVWTNLSGSYRLEQHAANGTRLKLIGVTIPASPAPIMTAADAESLIVLRERIRSSNAPGPGARAVRMSPPRLEMQIDADGLVWITRTIKAPRGDTIAVKPDFLAPNEAPGEGTIPPNTADRLHHTIIEVIDPVRGELIARKELPFAGLLVSPGFVGRLRADASEHYLIHVYRLALTRNETKR